MLNGTSVYPRVKTSVLLIKAPDHVKRSSGGISEAVDPPQPFRDLVPTGTRQGTPTPNLSIAQRLTPDPQSLVRTGCDAW
jgi:hypothetical protein